MNKIKRFGTIYLKDMTKEIEDTINSDETQMKNLFDKIEELEKIINEKNIEIHLFKEQNKIYKDIIDKKIINNKKHWKEYEFYIYLHNYDLNLYDELYINNYKNYKNYMNNIDITKEDINRKNDGPKLLNFNKMKEALKREDELESKNKIIQKVEPTYQMLEEENNSNKKDINEYIENKSDEHCEENISKNIDEVDSILPTPSITSSETSVSSADTHNTNSSPKRKDRNKTLSPLERYPVKIYSIDNNKNNELIEFIASESKVLIKFQSIIADKIKNDEKDWEEIYNFKIKNNELNNSRNSKKRFKYKIIRSKILYDKYGENLNLFKIYLSHLSDMSEEDWSKWLIEFDELFNNIYNNSIKCEFKYKNNKICNKYNCKIKHRIDTI